MAFVGTDIELTTHVGRGTPMSEMLRCYWVLADELPDPDRKPKAIRPLGEDLNASIRLTLE